MAIKSRDRDRDLDKMNSSALETIVSKSHHWLHQFQLVTEHSLKGATNYGNRATGVGTKHAVLRPRPRPDLCLQVSRVETETETEHSDLGHQVSRPRPGQNELECTRVSRPWSRDQNTAYHSRQSDQKNRRNAVQSWPRRTVVSAVCLRQLNVTEDDLERRSVTRRSATVGCQTVQTLVCHSTVKFTVLLFGNRYQFPRYCHTVLAQAPFERLHLKMSFVLFRYATVNPGVHSLQGMSVFSIFLLIYSHCLLAYCLILGPKMLRTCLRLYMPPESSVAHARVKAHF